MRMNFGSAPTKTTSRFPLHQRQVAHFFCPIGISTRPPKTKKAFSVAILQRRLVCPDGIRQRRTPQGSVVFSIFRSIRMITSLSEERMSVFYQLPNGPARTNWQWTEHTSHHTQYTDAPISNVAGFYIFTEIPGTVPARPWYGPEPVRRCHGRQHRHRSFTAHAGAGRP